MKKLHSILLILAGLFLSGMGTVGAIISSSDNPSSSTYAQLEFPHGTPLDLQLVINEIDYDQAGTDAAEFIELKNNDSVSINLDDITVELVNGSGGGAVVYNTIDLPDVNLAPGDYFVICGNAANEDATVLPVVLPSLSFSPGGSKVTVEKDDTVSLIPGSYGIVTVRRNGALQLAHDGTTGDYFFESLEVNKGGMLEIDVTAGPVNINVTRTILFIQDVQVVLTPPDATERIYFNSLISSDITIGAGSRVFGTIIAPHANVLFLRDSYFKGAVCSRKIKVNKGVTFLHHSSSNSLP